LWTGSAWQVTAATKWDYSTGCHLDAVVHDPAPFGNEETVTRYEYDCEGRLERTFDANHSTSTDPGDATRYTYDPLDRLATVLQPRGGDGSGDVTSAHEDDAHDPFTSLTRGMGNETNSRDADRIALMEQVSTVTVSTPQVYAHGGELALSRDWRGIETTRTID